MEEIIALNLLAATASGFNVVSKSWAFCTNVWFITFLISFDCFEVDKTVIVVRGI